MTVYKGTISGSGTFYDGVGDSVGITLSFSETLRGSVDKAGNASFTYTVAGTAALAVHYLYYGTYYATYPLNYSGTLVTNIHNFQHSVGGAGNGITLTGTAYEAPGYTPDLTIPISGNLYVPAFGYVGPQYLALSGMLTAFGGQIDFAPPPAAITRPASGTTPMTFDILRSGYTGGTDRVDWAVLGITNPNALAVTYPASPADFTGGVLPSGSIDFAPGQTIATVTIDIAGLPSLAASKVFGLQLSAPSPGASFGQFSPSNTLAEFATIASSGTLAPGEVRVAGPAGDYASLFFPDTVSAAAPLAIAAAANSQILGGQMAAVTATPGGAIPAIAASSGALVVHQPGTLAMPLGYTLLASDAAAPLTVQGGPLDGQAVLSGSGGLAFNAGLGAGTVIAAGGNNLISAYPGAGAQDVRLGAGDDTVIALAASATIAPGGGSNMILLGGGNSLVTSMGADLIAAGSGNATITAPGFANPLSVFLGSGNTVLQAGFDRTTVVAGNGSLIAQVPGGSQVWLGAGNATVTQNANAVPLGAVTLIGGSGSAAYYPFGAGDLIFGSSGPLVVDATQGASATTIAGGTGAMTLLGGSGMVALSYGATEYTGFGGSNTIAAFAGSLTVTGGAGVFAGSPAGHNVLAGSVAANAVLFGGGDGDVLSAGSQSSSPLAPVIQDALVAGPGAETLTGAGTSTAVSYYAGPGADLMIAGSGPSQMLDGTGAATMVGGAGLDLFAFAQGNAGSVTIQAFNPSLHYLSLLGFPAGEAAAALAGATSSGGNESLLLSDGTHITFQGFTGLAPGNFL